RFASNGGLVSYGPDLHELFRLAAGYVDPGPGPTAPTRSRKRLRKAPGTEGWIIWSEFEWDHSSAADQPDVSVINRQRQVPALRPDATVARTHPNAGWTSAVIVDASLIASRQVPCSV